MIIIILKTLFITTKINICTLRVNDLYTPMKRQEIFRLDKKKYDSTISCLQKTHFKMKEINELQKWGKMYRVNKIQKKTELTILNTKWISEKKIFLGIKKIIS